MKKLLTIPLALSLISACGKKEKPKTQVIYQPWLVVNTEDTTEKLLKTDATAACENIRQEVKYCEGIIQSIEEKLGFKLSNENTSIKLIEDKVVPFEDPINYDSKETTYEIQENNNTKKIIFKSVYDGSKGYLITFKIND